MSELAELHRRNGKPYSDGHRAMYYAVASLLYKKPARILEVGCGHGDGIEILLNKGCIHEMWAVEKDEPEAIYTKERFKSNPNIRVINHNWIDVNAVPFRDSFDYCTCMEVIEHIPPSNVYRFLRRIRQNITKNLFLSTPNSETHEHGARTPEAWCSTIRDAGFSKCTYVEHQWTTFFMANV